MNVFDSSALLAFLQAEPGADSVGDALAEGGYVGAANWSEVCQKVRARGVDWDAARGAPLGFGLHVAPVTIDDAEAEAADWRSGSPLSLADRLCLALALRLDATVWTADRAWADQPGVRVIR